MLDGDAPFHGNALLGSAFQQRSMQGGPTDTKSASTSEMGHYVEAVSHKANALERDS
jgi:hypothetical protein